MSKEISIVKRSGKKEKFSADKINTILQWACADVKRVSFEQVAMNAHLQFFEGITSKDIHNILIEAAAGLITEQTPQYQDVASRLLNYQLRKEVWGGKDAPRLYDFVKNNIENKIYDPEILNWYTKKEFDKLNDYIDHNRDFNFAYAGIKQLCEKYLVQDRVTKIIFETPQFAYMLIAMTLFKNYEEKRLEHIRKAYNAFSRHKINLPTPLMAGVRTTLKSYASCMLITVDDTLKSIFASNDAIGFATASRYGIGINFSRIRAVNSPVQNGTVVHTGPIPYLKMYEAAVKSCHQNGIRGGSATANVAFFHKDIEDILVLKNNAGTDDNRVRKLDYCIAFDGLFYERFLKNQDITLFSYHEVPELWNNFGMPGFRELYEKAEKSNCIKFKKTINTRELFMLFSKERFETGRMYVFNADHVNSHGSWVEQVDTTNLCVEVTHPLKPIYRVDDDKGEIGVCILAAVNLLEIKDDDDMRVTCDIIVRMLDELIDHQNYFAPAAEEFAKKRRSLGIGITNLAAIFAKEGVKYWDKKAPNIAAKLMESVSYYLLDASAGLAAEKGSCEKYNLTKFSQGVLPVDTYKKEIDEFVTEKLHQDWEALREKIRQNGLRNSTLTALMPCESSAVIQSSTNGIEPPRSLITSKRSKAGIVPSVVPNVEKHGNNYTLAFEMPSNEGYLKVVAALQKFVDMSISTNLYYNVNNYPGRKVTQNDLIKDILTAYKYGLKTLYYTNTYDGDTQTAINNEKQAPQKQEEIVSDDSGCAGGACTL